MIGADSVAAFEILLDEKTSSVHNRRGHGMTVYTADEIGIAGIRYNKQAGEKSWQAMKELPTEKWGN